MKAWWFGPDDKLPYGDGRPIVIGETHTVEGKIIPCQHGLHGSRRILDALKYASFSTIYRVRLEGEIVEHDGDKHAASERTYLWKLDATDILSKFARMCALDVVDLWEPPPIILQYLKTGKEETSVAAGNAAWATIRDAKENVTRNAAWAARNAAWASWNAAWAARNAGNTAWAARAASWATASDAVWDAAWATVSVAVRNAARDAVWDVGDTGDARDATWKKQNRRLTRMVLAARQNDRGESR